MIIAFDKALNHHRPSNTPSRVASVTARKTMSHHVQKGQTLTRISNLYVDSLDYILHDSHYIGIARS
jgi:phosphoribosylaminoimidazole-succinocarboxamide synthase